MIQKYPHFFITLFATILFIPFLGSVHLFDWDEINFAEAAREMILTGNYSRVQINFEPFWEKPPLFFWMQVISMKAFGINEMAARLPNAICGVLTLNLIFYYGKTLFSSKLAWWWVLLYIGSFTPHFYFKTGIIDPWFNLFIFLALIQLYIGAQKAKLGTQNFLFSGLFLGLALLTKGPVAVLIVGLCGLVYLIVHKFKLFFTFYQLLILFFSMLLLPLLWFVPDWIQNGFWFTREFLSYQVNLFLHPVASHGQPWFYHPVVLLIGCFPAAIIAIPYLINTSYKNNEPFILWMKIMFWVVLVLFSMVTTKIVHYSSLCYLPLTFLGALGLYQSNGLIKLWQKILISFIGLIYTLLFLLIPLAGTHSMIKNYLLKTIKDDFVLANIRTITPWLGWEWVLGLIFFGLMFIGILAHKKNNNGIKLLFIGNAFFLFLFSVMVIPKVENHVQGSIIDFYKTLQHQDIYIETVGFKSYAHYYYTQKQAPKKQDKLYLETMAYCKSHEIDSVGQLSEVQRNDVNSFKKTWFLKGEIDKPVYLVYKITNTEGMEFNTQFESVLNKGGFKVFKRKTDLKTVAELNQINNDFDSILITYFNSADFSRKEISLSKESIKSIWDNQMRKVVKINYDVELRYKIINYTYQYAIDRKNPVIKLSDLPDEVYSEGNNNLEITVWTKKHKKIQRRIFIDAGKTYNDEFNHYISLLTGL